jgi:hypothetical protein
LNDNIKKNDEETNKMLCKMKELLEFKVTKDKEAAEVKKKENSQHKEDKKLSLNSID